MSEWRLIVGLGNPGKAYEDTRHNLGFLVVEHLAQQEGVKWKSDAYCQGIVAQGEIFDKELLLLLPMTFMNNSGTAVKHIVKEKKLMPQNILVVCDDLNIEFGQLRLRKQGSAGGHNGLASIIDHLGSSDFPRLRVGIGRSKEGDLDKNYAHRRENTMVNFVLGKFTSHEKKQLTHIVDTAADCCRGWLTQEINEVMSAFNKGKNSIHG